MRLNVAFIPPDQVLDQAVLLSRQIASENDAYFILNQRDYLGHITIYSPEYAEEQTDNVIKALEELSKSFQPINFKFLKLASRQGYIGIEYKRTSEIQDVHEKLVNTLNPLRQGLVRDKYKNQDYKMNFSKEQIDNIEQYGYPDAMKLYKPHLTITRLKNEDVAKTITTGLNQNFEDFTVNKIGIYKMGEHGTATALISGVNLGA